MPKVILLNNVLIFKENFINGIFEESPKVTFYVIVDKAISYPISYGISHFTSPGDPGVTSSLANISSSRSVSPKQWMLAQMQPKHIFLNERRISIRDHSLIQFG
jgi:hypothetical protein